MAEAETSVAHEVLSQRQKKKRRKKRQAENAATAAATAVNKQREQNEQSNHDIEIAAASAAAATERRHSSEDEIEELQRALENKTEELQRALETIDELRSSLETEVAASAALAAEAASIANMVIQTTSTHTLKWTCNVCKANHFDSFEDAFEHEKSCTGHTVDAPAPRTTEESSRLQFEEQLAASNAKIEMLEQSLEQTKQSNQSIIEELESSKEHLVVELEASNAKNVLLEARLASTTDEVPSNSTKVDDNIARIEGIGGTKAEYKVWRNRQKTKKEVAELTSSHVNLNKCQPK